MSESAASDRRTAEAGCDVLVTGAAGFIGSHLTDRLLTQGKRVVGIDNFNDYYDPARKRSNIAAALTDKNFTLIDADVRDAAAMMNVFDQHRPYAVAHLAAYGGVRYSIGRAQLYTDVNIVGSVNLLEAARSVDASNFVFASTSSVYGHTDQLPFIETDPCNLPLAPYPASKKAVEVIGHTYHRLHQLNFTALRFFSVYGPRGRPDMMPYIVTDSLLKAQPITLYDAGQMQRDWTYIDDIVTGIIAALDRPLGYQIINLGRGEPILMTDFVQHLEQLTTKQAILQTPSAPPSEPKITSANIQKAQDLLDYAPQTPIKKGLAQLWRWYKQTLQSTS